MEHYPYWGKKMKAVCLIFLYCPNINVEELEENYPNSWKRWILLRAKRIEIPASITATPFYIKMGYNYKNGIDTPDDEGLLRLEKFI